MAQEKTPRPPVDDSPVTQRLEKSDVEDLTELDQLIDGIQEKTPETPVELHPDVQQLREFYENVVADNLKLQTDNTKLKEDVKRLSEEKERSERLLRGIEKYAADLKAENETLRIDDDHLTGVLNAREFVHRAKNTLQTHILRVEAFKAHLGAASFEEAVAKRNQNLLDAAKAAKAEGEETPEKIERREKEPIPVYLSIMMLDTDHFKKINDTYGHAAGDLVLKRLGEVLNSSIRPIEHDIVGRRSGDEFYLCITSEKDEELGQSIAKRLCTAISEIVVEYEGIKIPVSASIGVSNWVEGDQFEDTLSRADKALYLAKRAGRNQAVAEYNSVIGIDEKTKKDIQMSFYTFEGNKARIPQEEVQEYLQAKASE